MSVLREAAHAAIQHLVGASANDETDGALVTKWVIVTEILDADGEKHCCQVSGGPDGQELVTWDREGLLHYGLTSPDWAEDE
jgi:hypothetical protein